MMLASEIAKAGYKRRRILTDFVIDKIAAVDNPCNEHSRVAIIKRKDDDVVEKVTFPPGDPAEIAKAFAAMQAGIDRTEALIAKFNREREEDRRLFESGAWRREQKETKMDFMDHVATIQKRDGCKRSEAMIRAAEEEPDALAEFRAQKPALDPRAELIAKRYEKQADIDRRVREVMKRAGVSRTQALLTLNAEEPEIFE